MIKQLLDFIRANPDWERIIQAPPYCIKVSWSADYALFKYNQLNSDFSSPIVQGCRGVIIKFPEVKVVCAPFDKFFNYGEEHAAQIDWSTARVQEKIDGSLIKTWHHDGSWHVSTNGTIHASNAGTSIPGLTFFDVFCKAMPSRYCLEDFFNALDKKYTYMFEIVSPETRVTIDYKETALYYLGARNTHTLQEVSYPEETDDAVFFECVKLPKCYPLNTIEQCIEAAAQMSKDEEGFVVRDAAFNRIKVKSPEYLIAAKVRNNGVITVRRVIELMRAEKLDDFLAYAPQYTSFVKNILSTIDVITEAFNDSIYQLLRLVGANSASFNQPYLWIKQLPKQYQPFLFKVMQGKVANAREYVDGLRVSVLVDLIQQYEDCQN